MFETQEDQRLLADNRDRWLQWGPYLSERQWGTVREDYSSGGAAWESFPHDHARSRAYRWGEDGIAGLSDDRQRLCLSLAMWNGRDPILKERFFGLTNSEGNHGEDVKELYFYQEATPSHSLLKMRYLYPQGAFPYGDLVEENRRRKSEEPAAREYEIRDAGAFADGRYFDVSVEYAKRSPSDILARISVRNAGPETARLTLLPTLVFRNTWSWGGAEEKPQMRARSATLVEANHPELGVYRLIAPDADALLFCENETNVARLYDQPGASYPKDGINDHVVNGKQTVNPNQTGTKAAARHDLSLEPAETREVILRLTAASGAEGLGPDPAGLFEERDREAEAFFSARGAHPHTKDRAHIARQSYAGLIWSKQFFNYAVSDWLDGDSFPPPESRHNGRNTRWRHFHSSDIISMPDCWEYPWFASWDLCLHTIALARVDLHFAKEQILVLMREWHMHPDGQVPAYEWAFDDVNPPLQAWAALRVAAYEAEQTGQIDLEFLASVMDHCLIYFTWWVNRKDALDNNLFQGGFLGLDNISPFDRSAGNFPEGGRLFQSDGTAWVAFFALQLLDMAKILSAAAPEKSELVDKFFRHFVLIADAIEHITRHTGGEFSLWDDKRGLFFDVLEAGDAYHPIRTHSLVSLLPLIAVSEVDLRSLAQSGRAARKLSAFLDTEAPVARRILDSSTKGDGTALLSFLDEESLKKLLGTMLDEREFLSPFGLRSLSKIHEAEPYRLSIGGTDLTVAYEPGESRSGMFGGNSNWRGPVWMPMNYLIIDALRIYHDHYGDAFTVEFPTGSGTWMTLGEVADALSSRLISLFEPRDGGERPALADLPPELGRDDMLYYEYFHGDTGEGLGAAHQTGWTSLVSVLIEEQAKRGTLAERPQDGEEAQQDHRVRVWDEDAAQDAVPDGERDAEVRAVGT